MPGIFYSLSLVFKTTITPIALILAFPDSSNYWYICLKNTSQIYPLLSISTIFIPFLATKFTIASNSFFSLYLALLYILYIVVSYFPIKANENPLITNHDPKNKIQATYYGTYISVWYGTSQLSYLISVHSQWLSFRDPVLSPCLKRLLQTQSLCNCSLLRWLGYLCYSSYF